MVEMFPSDHSHPSFSLDTMDIITLNLPHGQGSIIDFAAVVKICLGVSLFFTYPMMLFPVTHLLDKSLGFTSAPHRGVRKCWVLGEG